MRFLGILLKVFGIIILAAGIIGLVCSALICMEAYQDKIRNERIAQSLKRDDDVAALMSDDGVSWLVRDPEKLISAPRTVPTIQFDSTPAVTLMSMSVPTVASASTPDSTPAAEHISVATPTPVLLARSARCLEVNPDYAYWINIPDTVVDYPVVQTADDDVDNPYLHMDFYREETPYGNIYASSVAMPDNTVILFGHAMKDGSQFKTLENYRDDNPSLPNFRENHMVVNLTTLYEERTYRVCAVYILNDGDDLNGDGARNYDDYFGIDNQVAFLQFLASYEGTFYLDPEAIIDESTNFLFLQSCTYTDEVGNSLDNARVVVMATMQDA